MDEPLKALEQLGAQFERLAHAAASRPPRRRRGLARWRVLALVVPGALAVAGAAMAARGILTGAPVHNPPGTTFPPDTGVGTPAKGQTKLLGLRVADPDGGPPWGMRTIGTTRGLSCVQIGRIVDGRLGVLGRDGAFGDDGRFHELPADVLTQSYCQQPDRAGNLFVAVSYQGMPAGAMAGSCRSPARHAPTGRQVDKRPACPAADERILYFGLLGPRATRIAYRGDAGTVVTTATSHPGGAYLVVLRPTATHPATGIFVPSASPLSGLSSVRYAGAPRCTIRSPRSLGGARACPLVGYVAPRVPRVTAAQVRTRVRAAFSPRAVRPREPGLPSSVHVPRQWKLTIVFRARHAGDARSNYVMLIRPQRGPRCGFMSFGPVTHDVRAGEVVRQTSYLPATCHGTVRGTVTFHSQPSRPGQMPFDAGAAGGGGIVVGRFEARIPR